MIKKNWVYIVFAIAILVFIFSKFYRKNNHYNNGNVELKVKTYKTDIGWGYDITANDTSLIHQNIIPGIAGRKGFATKEDAEKIGNLVIKKIKNKKLPAITLRELDSFKIVK
ncbi:MAG TPA: DUF4907 domain-containing protein [Chitinophagaceae bacterium]|nr:DUF4907 domain-containing protein [Chitinophagaceae bacterium]